MSVTRRLFLLLFLCLFILALPTVTGNYSKYEKNGDNGTEEGIKQFHRRKDNPMQKIVSKITAILKEGNGSGPRPPIILMPGLIASRLISWKPKKCKASNIEVQDLVWLNIQKVIETMTVDKYCWLDCLRLGKNGTDPKDCKLRPDEGLHAIGDLSGGSLFIPSATVVFTPLIKRLAEDYGYDSNSIIGAPYDWRLAPSQVESRDSYFSSLKWKIESAVKRHGQPAIVVAHSMGNNMFLYFCDWLREVDQPTGGWKPWLDKHIWTFVGFAAPLLGAPAALKSVISGHTFGLPVHEAQARDILLTFPSTHFLSPRSLRGIDDDNRSNGSCPLGPSTYSSWKTPVPSCDGDYDDPLVTFQAADPMAVATLSSGGSSVSNEAPSSSPVVAPTSTSSVFSTPVTFSVKQVDNGEIFQWMADNYRDPMLQEKCDQWKRYYEEDPLKPLRKRPRRPPVKHVIMIYGVDMPTEVGYLYRMPQSKGETASSTTASAKTAQSENNNESPFSERANSEVSADPIKPVLIELYVEESYGEHVLQQRRQQRLTLAQQSTSSSLATTLSSSALPSAETIASATASASAATAAATAAVLETYSAASIALQDTISNSLNAFTTTISNAASVTAVIESNGEDNDRIQERERKRDVYEQLTKTYTIAAGQMLKQAMTSFNKQAQAASKLLKLSMTAGIEEEDLIDDRPYVGYGVSMVTDSEQDVNLKDSVEGMATLDDTIGQQITGTFHLHSKMTNSDSVDIDINVNVDVISSSKAAVEQSSVDTISDTSIITSSAATGVSVIKGTDDTEEKQMKDRNEVHRLSLVHKAEIFAVSKKNIANSVPIVPTSLVSSKKLVRTSQFHHSGDNTVPYISLSFAKTWLEQYDSISYPEQCLPEKDEANITAIISSTGGSVFRRFPRSLQSLFAMASKSVEPDEVSKDENALKAPEGGEGIIKQDEKIEGEEESTSNVVKKVFTDAITAANNFSSQFFSSLPSLPPKPSIAGAIPQMKSIRPSSTSSRSNGISSNETECSSIKKWEEYRPARIHTAKHLLDNLPQHNKVIDPAVEIFSTENTHTGETTMVIEVSEVDHLDISKHPFVLDVMFEMVLPRMAKDLYADEVDW